MMVMVKGIVATGAFTSNVYPLEWIPEAQKNLSMYD